MIIVLSKSSFGTILPNGEEVTLDAMVVVIFSAGIIAFLTLQITIYLLVKIE